MAHSEIRTAFHGALTLVGASGLALGCTSLGDDDDSLGWFRQEQDALRVNSGPSARVAQQPGFEELPCDASERPSPLYMGDLLPEPAVDYVELRSYGGVVDSQGEACFGATDPARCLEELALPDESSSLVLGHIVQVYVPRLLSATRGSEIIRVRSAAELSVFLGAIDSPGEARLLVASRDYSLECGTSGSMARDGGFDVLAFTYEGCEGRTRHLLHVGPSGEISTSDRFVERTANPGCIVGRIPPGLDYRAPANLRHTLAGFFSNCAELEAASVEAFVGLARELDAHGAPSELYRRARSAAQDEVRHAHDVARLARSFGGKPHLKNAPAVPVRKLEDVAIENAVEGCVRETYGALLAHYQNQHTPLAEVGAVYGPIAEEETRHAELSWDVARWAETKLTARANRRVAQARRQASESLVAELRAAVPMPIDALVGLPSPRESAAMAEHLSRQLWGTALSAQYKPRGEVQHLAGLHSHTQS